MNVESYNKVAKEKNWSPLILHRETVCGFWWFGHWFATGRLPDGSYFYGAYPRGYLDRMYALFQEEVQGQVLHLFSGTIRGDGEKTFTFDIKNEVGPTNCGDAHKISEVFEKEKFDIIFADPPYGENYKKYKTDPIRRKVIIRECISILKDGGFLVWLDTIIPQWRNLDGWRYRGNIGIAQSTNHVVRGVTILQKDVRRSDNNGRKLN